MAHREIPLGRTGSAEYLLRGAWVYRRTPRAPETVGGGSGCGSEWDGLDLVDWHSRIPGGEEVAQRAVEGAGSGLQEPVGTRL
jgi:hypothetical protein